MVFGLLMLGILRPIDENHLELLSFFFVLKTSGIRNPISSPESVAVKNQESSVYRYRRL